MRVAITAIGAVTGFGVGIPALREAIGRGRSAVRPITRFDASRFVSQQAALVPGAAGTPEAMALDFAEQAAEEALGALSRANIGLVLGTNLVDRDLQLDRLAQQLAQRVGLTGPVAVSSTACASSASAIALATSWVERGVCSRVLVGGTDVVTDELMDGFDVIGALGADACSPFGESIGLNLGEGAGFLVIESMDAAQTRGAPVLATLDGWGFAADAHHHTAPCPQGSGFAAALRAAGATAARFVSAHGTGTEANDLAELRGVHQGAPNASVASAKGLLGHAQGAASVLELIVALLCREGGEVHPNWGTRKRRAGMTDKALLAPAPAEAGWAKLAAAFGGVNIALALDTEATTPALRSVYLTGASAVVGRDAAEAACRRADLSREDLQSTLSVGAAQEALKAARWRPTRVERERIGAVVALRGASSETLEAARKQRETGRMHAGTFARLPMVSAAGLVSRTLGLRGPLDVVCGEAAVGLALFWAATMLQRHDLDGMLVVAPDPAHDRARGWVLRTSAPGRRLVAQRLCANRDDVENALGTLCWSHTSAALPAAVGFEGRQLCVGLMFAEESA